MTPNELSGDPASAAVLTVRLWSQDGGVVARVTTVDDLAAPDEVSETSVDVARVRAAVDEWLSRTAARLSQGIR